MAYSKCPVCGKTMAKGHGCLYSVLVMEDGPAVPRMRYGDNGEWCEEPCPDCNVKAGQFHHPGCDTAVCAVCGGQESFCDCPIKGYR